MKRIAIGIAASAIALLAMTGHHGDITDNARVPTTTGLVCRIEPSDTPEGFEIIAYHDLLGPMPEGFVVPCPNAINGG